LLITESPPLLRSIVMAIFGGFVRLDDEHVLALLTLWTAADGMKLIR